MRAISSRTAAAAPPANEARAGRPLTAVSSPAGDEPSFLTLTTTVLWLGFATVGGLGGMLAYPRPAAPVAPPPPVVAELLQVDLSTDPLPEPASAPATPAAVLPPPALEAPGPPPAPALSAVAEPSAAVAFPLPADVPARVVGPAEAASAPPSSTNTLVGSARGGAGPATAVKSLTYGEGDGRQPAPRYPVRARQAGQEGTVVVRLTVGSDGRVLTAEAADPSPWPMLNEEAVRTVRSAWRFRPGPARLYQVAIRFKLTD